MGFKLYTWRPSRGDSVLVGQPVIEEVLLEQLRALMPVPRVFMHSSFEDFAVSAACSCRSWVCKCCW